MARDYANPNYKKQPTSRRRSTKKKNASHKFLWLFTGLILGVGSSGMVYMHMKNPELISGIATKISSKAKKNIPVKKQKAKKVAQSKPHFDFYTLLPNQEVTVDSNKAKKSKEYQPSTTNPTKRTDNLIANKEAMQPKQPLTQDYSDKKSNLQYKYYVQIGTFRKFENADKLKAELAFKGISTKINTAYHNGKEMYRVFIGPFSDPDLAHDEQQHLALNHIPSNLVSVVN